MSTRQLGCADAFNPDGCPTLGYTTYHVVVCMYSPRGNLYTVGQEAANYSINVPRPLNSPPPRPPPSPPLFQASMYNMTGEYVDKLNYVRRRHMSPALVYNAALVNSALAFAQDLSNNCYYR